MKHFIGLFLVLLFIFSCSNTEQPAISKSFKIGDKVDSLYGVYVYYNAGIGNVSGRQLAPDGYNLGLKYQCVEFVKRYYYEYYHHKMPNSYGNAKDFFEVHLKDGELNKDRNLLQFTNPSNHKPEKGDLIIMSGHVGNPYGHVAIVSKVEKNQLEIIQQNPGPSSPSRVFFNLAYNKGRYFILNSRILGWLRKNR